MFVGGMAMEDRLAQVGYVKMGVYLRGGEVFVPQ
jgi:hypothetical protein